MKNTLKEIKTGTGLGIIKFGMNRNEIRDLLGEPDEIEAFSYTESDSDLTESWHYDEMEVSLGFDEVDDWRLVTLSITSGFYEFHGQKIIGKSKDEILALLNSMQIKDLNVEGFSTPENTTHEVVASDSLSMNFWFDEGVLAEIQWSPFINEDETVKWPK